MPKVPAIPGKDVIRAFGKCGFALDRIEGSHHILKRPGHRFVLSVPVHGGDTVGQGLLKKLIRAAGLTVDEFIDLLK